MQEREEEEEEEKADEEDVKAQCFGAMSVFGVCCTSLSSTRRRRR